MRETETQQARYGSAYARGATGASPLVVRPSGIRGVLARIGDATIGWLKTAAITLGTAYVVGFVMFLSVTVVANRTQFVSTYGFNTYDRIQRMKPVRAFGAEANPAITPMEAGIAFDRLQPTPNGKSANGFRYRDASRRPERTWASLTYTPEMFVDARPTSWNGPLSTKIIHAAAKGFSAREKVALRTIAMDPAWKDFDIVARAPAVDFLGGRFEPPFGPNATAYMMPIAKFAATKEVAYAAVSRAAWHFSDGRRDSAEVILRSIISYGYAMVDNGTFIIDDLIGVVIAGIGRDGLAQLYEVTGDPRATQLRAIDNRVYTWDQGSLSGLLVKDIARQRAALVDIANDREVPNAFRMEALLRLVQSTCTDPREIVAGPGKEVEGAFERARRDLARYPAERATLDLVHGFLDNPDALGALESRENVREGLSVMGRLYFNRRLASCSLVPLTRGQF